MKNLLIGIKLKPLTH